ILAAMMEVETQTARVPDLEKAVSQAKEDAARMSAGIQSRADELTAMLDNVRKQTAEVEASLAEDVRTQYDRLVAAHGEDALSSVQGRTCSACYTEITAQNYNDLLQGKFVVCRSCGRMLYLPQPAPAKADVES